MRLGSQVTYAPKPGLVATFNGFSENAGRKMASVKFPGKPPIQVPAERVAPAEPKLKTGPKTVSQAEWDEVAHRYGHSRADVLRIARGNGVTVRQAVDDLLECEDGCECAACKGAV